MKKAGKRITCIAFALLIGGSRMTAQGVPAELQSQLNQERMRLAPDKRVAVFDVRISSVHGMNIAVQGEIQDSKMKRQLVNGLKDRGWKVNADSLAALPEASVVQTPHALACVSVVNIRVKPDNAAEMATQALLGTPLKILREHDGWYLVQTPDAYLGWTEGNLRLMSDSAYNAWLDRPKVIVTSTYAFSHATQDSEMPYVSDLVAGSILVLGQELSSSYAVEYPDGRTAFVRKTDAQPFGAWLGGQTATGPKLVETAEKFMGIPYLWGGTSTKGMDCSGFTKTVYFLSGILLPRDASQQAYVGKAVDGGDSLDQFQPGDLLFFGFRARGEKKERVTHVAMSLGGRRYIHSSGDVHINSLDPSDRDYNDYRRQMFLHARRILGTGKDEGVQRLADMHEYKR